MTITQEQVKEWLLNDEEIVKCVGEDGDIWSATLEEIVRWGECSPDIKTIIDTDIPVESILVHGGGEGDGEEYYIVFKIGETIWRVDGWYASHHGSELDYDSLREVKAQEKTVIVYE
jgi:hypothetical protein